MGYSRKNPDRGVEDVELAGVLKKLQEEFPRVNLKQSGISRGDQENWISRGLGFRS